MSLVVLPACLCLVLPRSLPTSLFPDRHAPRLPSRFPSRDCAGYVHFKRTKYDVMDNRAAVKLSVERSKNMGKMTVRFTTVDGTAKAGENYVRPPFSDGIGTATFLHGENLASVEIRLRDTMFAEHETFKTFAVRLLGASMNG